jgi:hypothetical protein
VISCPHWSNLFLYDEAYRFPAISSLSLMLVRHLVTTFSVSFICFTSSTCSSVLSRARSVSSPPQAQTYTAP